MEWKEWDFYSEGQKQGAEDETLLCETHCLCSLKERGNMKAVRDRCVYIEINESHQHQQATQQCVNEKFQRNPGSFFSAPQEQDEIHRYQGQLPENVKQKSVGCCEDA